MKKDTNLRERIEKILSETKWKQTTLAEQTGIPVQFFADCKRGKSKSISREYAEMIHNALPQYDIDWIIDGIAIDNNDSSQTTHKMLANNLGNVSKQSSNCLNVDSETDSNKLIAELRETISRQQEQINRLNREIDGLYERIDELKELIAVLKKENAPTTIAHTA